MSTNIILIFSSLILFSTLLGASVAPTPSQAGRFPNSPSSQAQRNIPPSYDPNPLYYYEFGLSNDDLFQLEQQHIQAEEGPNYPYQREEEINKFYRNEENVDKLQDDELQNDN